MYGLAGDVKAMHFCNTTVRLRLERRRTLWTDTALLCVPPLYLACRHQRTAKTLGVPHMPSHHDRTIWEHSRSIAVMDCGVSLAVPGSILDE